MSKNALNGADDSYFCLSLHVALMRIREFFFFLLITCMGLFTIGCKNNTESAYTGGPVYLLFNFQPGSTYEYIFDSKLTLQPEVNGTTISISQDMKIMSQYEVISNDGKSKNIEVTYNRITMRSGNDVKSLEYDSDDTVAPHPIFQSVGGLVKKPFGITVSEKGDITNVRKLDTDSTGANILGDSSIRKMMTQCLYIYPDNAVKPGDTWQRAFHSSIAFIHMQVSSTYTLTNIDKGTAYVNVISKIMPEDSTSDNAFSGSQSGKLEIDIASGLVIKANITQELDGKFPSPGGEIRPVKATAEINIFGNKL